MPTGKALIDEIDTAEVIPGQVAFWWLGQHSFAVKTSDHIIYLDPFLSPSDARLVPSLLAPDEVNNAELVTGSHDHGDHIDRKALPGIMQASRDSRLIAPLPAREPLEKLNLNLQRVHFMDDEDVLNVNGMRITAIKAAHELLSTDDSGHHEYLSFVIQTDGVTIYHAGDTCMYEGMASRLKRFGITVAFLPINGRDAERLRRNCIGNMTYQEAADLAGILKPRMTIPAHYEMFKGNQEDPQKFTDYMDVKYPDLPYWVGEHGTMVKVLHRFRRGI
ncbi:MBL fold metallo-hydrolase [Planctomycetota bacterium]